MRAMILAAGRGERLRPLTDRLPKPLVAVGGERLIARHLRHLSAAGFSDVVINLWHGADAIRKFVGDGSRWNLRVHYSPEQQLLGTAGGIRQAIALGLLDSPFVVVNADIRCDADFSRLRQTAPPTAGAHLLLIPNPPHHPAGDFSLGDDGGDGGGNHRQLSRTTPRPYTYTGIGVFCPQLFTPLAVGLPHHFLPLITAAITNRRAVAEIHPGFCNDLGTPRRLISAIRCVKGG